MDTTYEVKQTPIYKRARLLATDEVIGHHYDVVRNGELYGRLDNERDAKIIAYGLNAGYEEAFLGGLNPANLGEVVAVMTAKGLL